MEDDDQSFSAICYVCEKSFQASGLLGGKAVCNVCYPIWFKGVMEERQQWEKWTGKEFLEMYHQEKTKDKP
jgi:hypothetical protein